jgi:hypothetical protein
VRRFDLLAKAEYQSHLYRLTHRSREQVESSHRRSHRFRAPVTSSITLPNCVPHLSTQLEANFLIWLHYTAAARGACLTITG